MFLRAAVRGLTRRCYTTEQVSLMTRLKEDRKQFMREKKQPDLNVVKNILSDYTYHIKSPNAKPNEREDAAVVSVIQKLVKKRQDAIQQYKAGGRPELAEQEEKELQVLKRYLPEPMAPEEIEKRVKGIIEQVGAVSVKDMGKVMKAWTVDAALADKKTVSDVVKKLLSSK